MGMHYLRTVFPHQFQNFKTSPEITQLGGIAYFQVHRRSAMAFHAFDQIPKLGTGTAAGVGQVHHDVGMIPVQMVDEAADVIKNTVFARFNHRQQAL
jgi:hypothetical protein